MAKKVIWTERAQNERIEILQFWIEHTHSFSYSKKLDSLFKKAVKLIKTYPRIGKSSDIDNVRIKIVGHYLIFYELEAKKIHILAIWDSRRNPVSLRL